MRCVPVADVHEGSNEDAPVLLVPEVPMLPVALSVARVPPFAKICCDNSASCWVSDTHWALIVMGIFVATSTPALPIRTCNFAISCLIFWHSALAVAGMPLVAGTPGASFVILGGGVVAVAVGLGPAAGRAVDCDGDGDGDGEEVAFTVLPVHCFIMESITVP